jgi:cell division protein FtsB
MIMRITTQMVNESARKAGLPVNNTSLLNYINKDSSTTENSLLDALNKNSKVNSTQKSSYEQLEKSANALEGSAAVFASEKEDNLFTQAKKDDTTEVVKKQAKEFISNYNDMMKKLGSSDSVLNDYYKQMLQKAYTENKEDLSGIGIAADRNGYLSLDESKFDAADIDTLENVLGGESTFSVKTGYIASRIANNAESYLESMSSQYSAAGNNYSTYLSSKYDFWG